MIVFKRTSTDPIRYMSEQSPCVLVYGARGVGKTHVLREVFPNAVRIDLERYDDFDLIYEDPTGFLAGCQGVTLIEEVHHFPQLAEVLADYVSLMPDNDARFILTSSLGSVADTFSKALGDNLVLMELGGLHIEEAWSREPSYFYELMLTGNANDMFSLVPEENSEEIFKSCLQGSYPAVMTGRDAREWQRDWFRDYILRDLQTHHAGVNPRTYYHFLKMLASASGHIQNASNLARSLRVSVPTIQKYLAIAEELMIWRQVPGFPEDGGKRVVKMPRGHLRDMGLLNFFLGIDNQENLQSHVNINAVWQSFIIEQLALGLQNRFMPVKLWHYRTHNQATVDLILEGEFGILPIVIKLGQNTRPGKVRGLNAFVRDFGCPYGMVINNSKSVSRISERLIQVPATCL